MVMSVHTSCVRIFKPMIAMNVAIPQLEPIATSPAPAKGYSSLYRDTKVQPEETFEPRIKILYAEDDPSIRRACYRVLQRAGYEVDAVADGLDAWDALQEQAYQLLITDNDMPCLKGADLVRKVRRAGLDVPIIFASGMVTEYDCQHCDALLAKPFTGEDLLNSVRGVLRTVANERLVLGLRASHW